MPKVSTKAPIFDKVGRPALDPEAREKQLIALAVDRAEQQLLDGTASSQVITHYLKLEAMRQERELDIQMKEKELELIQAKTENLKSAARSDEMFAEAIKAFTNYSGKSSADDHE